MFSLPYDEMLQVVEAMTETERNSIEFLNSFQIQVPFVTVFGCCCCWRMVLLWGFLYAGVIFNPLPAFPPFGLDASLLSFVPLSLQQIAARARVTKDVVNNTFAQYRSAKAVQVRACACVRVRACVCVCSCLGFVIDAALALPLPPPPLSPLTLVICYCDRPRCTS